MPAPPHARLRLQKLEDRSLMSASFGSLAPVPATDVPLPYDRNLLLTEYDSWAGRVVTGTDGNDLITLTRLDENRVAVTVQSFLDREWTQPTGDPITYDLAPGQIAGVNGGAGHDRVRIVDPIFGDVLLWDTNLRQVQTITVWTPGPDGSFVPHTEEYESSYARLDATDSAPATLTDGAEMDDGAEVGVFFDSWIWIDAPIVILPIFPMDPPTILPWPAPWDPAPEPGIETWFEDWAMTLDLPAGDLPSIDEAAILIDWAEGDWPADGLAWADGDVGSDAWSDQGDLADLWVVWADDVPIDESDWWTGEDSFDGLAEEDLGEWLASDTEDGTG